MAFNLTAAKRAIRAECTKQCIDDDCRRGLMRRLAGVDSSTNLDGAGARRMLDYLHGKKSAAAGRRYPQHEWTWVDTAPEHKRSKLRKLIMLAKGAGIAKGRQVAWIEGIARRMAGVAGGGPIEKPLAMCDDGELWRLIQAVAVHVQRKGGDPNAV